MRICLATLHATPSFTPLSLLYLKAYLIGHDGHGADDIAILEFTQDTAHEDMVRRILATNPALVGRPAAYIAQQAGLTAPDGTRVLLAELAGVGRDFPLSIEKLCPVLSFYVVKDWREGCERCKQILRYGGMGHTMSIHSKDDDIILQFGLYKPAFRIVVPIDSRRRASASSSFGVANAHLMS